MKAVLLVLLCLISLGYTTMQETKQSDWKKYLKYNPYDAQKKEGENKYGDWNSNNEAQKEKGENEYGDWNSNNDAQKEEGENKYGGWNSNNEAQKGGEKKEISDNPNNSFKKEEGENMLNDWNLNLNINFDVKKKEDKKKLVEGNFKVAVLKEEGEEKLTKMNPNLAVKNDEGEQKQFGWRPKNSIEKRYPKNNFFGWNPKFNDQCSHLIFLDMEAYKECNSYLAAKKEEFEKKFSVTSPNLAVQKEKRDNKLTRVDPKTAANKLEGENAVTGLNSNHAIRKEEGGKFTRFNTNYSPVKNIDAKFNFFRWNPQFVDPCSHLLFVDFDSYKICNLKKAVQKEDEKKLAGSTPFLAAKEEKIYKKFKQSTQNPTVQKGEEEKKEVELKPYVAEEKILAKKSIFRLNPQIFSLCSDLIFVDMKAYKKCISKVIDKKQKIEKEMTELSQNLGVKKEEEENKVVGLKPSIAEEKIHAKKSIFGWYPKRIDPCSSLLFVDMEAYKECNSDTAAKKEEKENKLVELKQKRLAKKSSFGSNPSPNVFGPCSHLLYIGIDAYKACKDA